MGIPNLRIVMRDDWIEITVCSWYAGFTIWYKFYSDGTVTMQDDCDIDGNNPITRTDVYSALSTIADISADNLQAQEENS